MVLLLLLAVLVWSDQPRFRHGFVADVQACSVVQLANLPRDADFLAIGSSRLLMGLEAQSVEAASEGHLKSAYNLGRVRRSIERSYRIFRDVLEAGGRPRYVFIEVSQDRLSGVGQTPFPVPRDAAFIRYADAWLYLDALSGIPWLERLHFVFRHTLHKLDTSIKHLLSGDAWAQAVARLPDVPKVCRGEATFQLTPGNRRAIAQQEQVYRKRFGDLQHVHDDSFKLGTSRRAEVELYFVDRIRQLAKAHDVTMLVGIYWRAYRPPMSARAIDDLRTVIPELVYPPAELVRSTWDAYLDKTHMDDAGRRQYSEWIGMTVAGRSPGVQGLAIGASPADTSGAQSSGMRE
ncbi:MAG: hypothetical protein R3E99_01790 [Burkholderiaceae bacterium]